jgi:hypothetical protein
MRNDKNVEKKKKRPLKALSAKAAKPFVPQNDKAQMIALKRSSSYDRNKAKGQASASKAQASASKAQASASKAKTKGKAIMANAPKARVTDRARATSKKVHNKVHNSKTRTVTHGKRKVDGASRHVMSAQDKGYQAIGAVASAYAALQASAVRAVNASMRDLDTMDTMAMGAMDTAGRIGQMGSISTTTTHCSEAPSPVVFTGYTYSSAYTPRGNREMILKYNKDGTGRIRGTLVAKEGDDGDTTQLAVNNENLDQVMSLVHVNSGNNDSSSPPTYSYDHYPMGNPTPFEAPYFTNDFASPSSSTSTSTCGHRFMRTTPGPGYFYIIS